MKNPRHASLDWNVYFMSVKLYHWEMSIKRDVLAQQIQVFISQFSNPQGICCYLVIMNRDNI